MAHRHNRIKRRKLLRFHSKKKYRRKKRGHYSQCKCLRRTVNKKHGKTHSETLLGAKFESLVVKLVKVIFPLEKNSKIKKIFREAVTKGHSCFFNSPLKIHHIG